MWYFIRTLKFGGGVTGVRVRAALRAAVFWSDEQRRRTSSFIRVEIGHKMSGRGNQSLSQDNAQAFNTAPLIRDHFLCFLLSQGTDFTNV